MKFPLLLVLALPLVPLPSAAEKVELRCAPAKDLVLRRTYSNPGHKKLAGMTLRTPDGEQPAPKLELEVETSQRIVVVDRFVAVEEGRPTRLRRTFEELGDTSHERTSSQAGDRERKREKESGLEGRTVVFTWDPEKEAYAAAYGTGEGEAGEEDLLADLRADVDLRDLLPGKAVEEGDEWKAEAQSLLGGVLEPCGDVVFHDEEARTEAETVSRRKLRESISGDVHLKLAGTRLEGGRRVAVLALSAELEGASDIVPEKPGPGLEKMAMEMRFDLEGELLWDLERNLAHSFELRTSGKQSVTRFMAFDVEGRRVELEQVMELDVEETYTASFEVEE